MGEEGVLELADDVAGWVILARKELSGLYGIHKSVNGRRSMEATYPILGRKDGTSGAIHESTSEFLGTLPNNLGEVRVGGVLGVIIIDFICPTADQIGDGVSASPGGQVLCGFDHEHLV